MVCIVRALGPEAPITGFPMSITIPQGRMYKLRLDLSMLAVCLPDICGPASSEVDDKSFESKRFVSLYRRVYFITIRLRIMVSSHADLLSVLSRASVDCEKRSNTIVSLNSKSYSIFFQKTS